MGLGNARMRITPEHNTLIPKRIVTFDVFHHTVIVVDIDGRVFTWGENSRMSCSSGDCNVYYATVFTPTLMQQLVNVRIKSVCCGDGFFMATSYNGYHLFIWGEEKIYKTNKAISRVCGMRLGEGRRIKKVVCGDKHAIILLTNGEVWGLGDIYDGYGEQSNNSENESEDSDATVIYTVMNYKPVRMLMNKHIQDVDCGVKHTLYLENNGALHISGFYTRKTQDIIYILDRNVERIQCGMYSSMWLTKEGQLKVVGENSCGEISSLLEHRPTLRNITCIDFPKRQ